MEHRRPSAEPQKKSGREKAKKEVQGDGDEEGEEVAPGGRVGEDKRRRPCSSAASKRGSGGGGGGSRGGAPPPRCQAEKCTADLAEAKRYYRRHKVCEAHSKAAVVIVAGLRQRFCQQCSRFHELSEFDDSKRSCRRRLAGHNERRRKNTTSETQGDRLKPLQASRPRWEDSDE